ncbi:MAG: radical SAM protein [Bacilli bacterium]|nr:radical SAM protein [Bacilli bacterium]
MRELYEYKLDLLYYGVSISDNCYAALKKGGDGKVNNDDYITTKGLMIMLDDSLYVNANLNKSSRYLIDFNCNRFSLKYDDVDICSVKVIQPPDFALNKVSLSSGVLVTTVVNVHGDRLRLQPIQGCANRCNFCDINKLGYFEHSIKNLDEGFMYALDNVGFRHVLISGGSPLPRNESYEYLNKVYKYFGEKYGDEYPIDVMLVPRGLSVEDNNIDGYRIFLNKLKSWKISVLSINLELYNDEVREKFIPQKDIVGKENYFEFIRLAVEIFGRENVRSCIIIGLESMEDSLNAVRELCKIGCMPVLSPYVPNDDMIDAPSPEFMKEVLDKTREIISEYNIELGPLCESCRHNTIHYK